MSELQKEAEAATSPPISSTTSSDRDDNYEFYRQHQGLEYTPDEAKRTLRKIDLQLIPLLFVIYMIQVRFLSVLIGNLLGLTFAVPGQE